MDRLLGMGIFTKVVELGGFSRAADHLQVSNAAVTNVINKLEAHLGVRLLQRTTRSLNLTEDGAAFYESCKRILADVEETEAALSRGRIQARGSLRVEMPTAIGRFYVAPALPRFAAQHPELRITALFNDRTVNLISEGVDAAIRVGALGDSTLVARQVYEARVITCASPEFLARFGEPTTPADLARFPCLGYFSQNRNRIVEWRFAKDAEQYVHKPDGQISLSNAEALADAGVRGAGIICLLDIVVSREVSAGLLRPILTDWQAQRAPVSVIYPHGRHLSAKVRAFHDFVADLFPRPASVIDAPRRAAPR
jgi:LysR family transcriptional regulator for bpeEF and oprC